MRLLFRCETGPDIGLGHLVRCLALGQFAERRGHTSRFLVTESWPGLDRFAGANRIELEVVEAGDSSVVREAAAESDAVVIDGYDFDETYQALLRKHAPVVLIDDLGDRSVSADIVVNHNPYATSLDYGDVQQLLGPRFALLRPTFADARREFVFRQELCRIFVMFGGSDPTDELPAVLDALASLDAKIDVITALSGERLDQLRRRVHASNGDVALHVSVPDPASLISQSDLGVTAAGGTSWELACIGVPAIEYVVADNQAEIGRWLSENDMAVIRRAPVDPDDLRNIIDSLRSDARRRKNLSDRARTLIDGRGADRVLSAIEELV